jgi:hypothetical protein
MEGFIAEGRIEQDEFSAANERMKSDADEHLDPAAWRASAHDA